MTSTPAIDERQVFYDDYVEAHAYRKQCHDEACAHISHGKYPGLEDELADALDATAEALSDAHRDLADCISSIHDEGGHVGVNGQIVWPAAGWEN